jgi:hypothetical protein
MNSADSEEAVCYVSEAAAAHLSAAFSLPQSARIVLIQHHLTRGA